MNVFLILSHAGLIATVLYSLIVMQSFTAYTVFKVAESVYVLLTSLQHKSSFGLKPAVLTLYAVGDLVIQYKMIPAILCFLCGHLLLFTKFHPQTRHWLAAVPLAVLGPLFFYLTDHCSLPFCAVLFVYALILATTFTSSFTQPDRTLSTAALLFFVSDLVLSVKEFSADLLKDLHLQISRAIVLLTYYFATITYAVKL